jgi:prevent-host-death family protein
MVTISPSSRAEGRRIGTRELRADLATMIRRAAAGQRIVVTVGGRSSAVLGPVEDSGGVTSLDALVSAGLLLPPRRADSFRPVAPVPVWSGVRLDRALREVRG